MLIKQVQTALWFDGRIGKFSSYLTFDAGQTAAARLGLAESLAVTTTVLPRDSQLVQLPLLLLINLLHTGCFEQRVPTFRWVRLEEGAFLQVGSTDVDVLLWDVIHRELLSLLALLGSILSQLEKAKHIKYLIVTLSMTIFTSNYLRLFIGL